MIVSIAAIAPADAAPAELALGEANLQLGPRATIFEDKPADPYFRLGAFAQVVGGGEDKGDLGVGAAVAITGLGCDLVNAAAQGRVRPFADAVLLGNARYSICLSQLLLTVAFDGDRGVGLAPALAARSSLWRRRYSHEFDRISVGFGELWDDDADHVRHTILKISVGHGGTTQADTVDAAVTRTIKELEIEAVIYRLRVLLGTYDSTLDMFTLQSSGIKDVTASSTSNLGGVASAFYLANLRVHSPDGFFGEGRAGWGFTGGQLSASGSTEVDGETVSQWSETIDSSGLPDLSRGVGAATLGYRAARFHAEASATASRSFYPTFDGNLALEDRIAGNLAVGITRGLGTTDRPLAIALSPFATRTQTWTRAAMMAGAPDGHDATVDAYGATLQVGRDVSSLLRVDGIAELGRSPYARLDDGDRAPTAAAVGGQILVALTARRHH